MPVSQDLISKILFNKAQELHIKPRYIVPFTNIPESDAILNNIEEYPHFFVLGCIMDRQIPAEKAWNIPYIISKECGGKKFSNFLSLDRDSLYSIFSGKRLHRFNEQMANYFYQALQIIHSDYKDTASNIWVKGKPTCREVIDRFATFPGVGQKISTMATNILVREFKVPLKNTNEIDISVDSQVEKVFKRIGFVPEDASKDMIINAARKIFPEYPGIIDSVVWEIGREWCKSDFSLCTICFLNEDCPKKPISLKDNGKMLKDNQNFNKDKAIYRKNSKITKVKQGKFRSRFEETLNSYCRIIPDNFSLRLSSSQWCCSINGIDIPDGWKYEFDDWHNSISVELSISKTRSSKIQAKLVKLSEEKYESLPIPLLTSQKDWLRLQFFFDESISVDEIAKAMNYLIDMTHSSIQEP